MFARYIFAQRYSVRNGSSPMTTRPRPVAVVCENGPSMTPFAPIGLESTSPYPTIPASVVTLTIKAS